MELMTNVFPKATRCNIETSFREDINSNSFPESDISDLRLTIKDVTAR